MTRFLTLHLSSFALGLGEGQRQTEANAGFSGCQPKEVGRVTSEKTAGLGCLPSPWESHRGNGRG